MRLYGAVTGKGGFGWTAGYADFSFVLFVCHSIYCSGGERWVEDDIGILRF